MPKVSYIYCDSNVFLSYFNAQEERVNLLEQLFEKIQTDRQLKLITSVITITEVSHVAEERKRHQLDAKVYDAIEAFWGDNSLIEFVDFSEFMARQARDLIRQAIDQKYVLKPNDAIQLASAKYVGINECFTYDKSLEKFSALTGYSIREPYLTSPRLFEFPDDPPTE